MCTQVHLRMWSLGTSVCVCYISGHVLYECVSVCVAVCSKCVLDSVSRFTRLFRSVYMCMVCC